MQDKATQLIWLSGIVVTLTACGDASGGGEVVGKAFDHPSCPEETAGAPGELRACGAIDLGLVQVSASPEALRRPVRMTATPIATPPLPDGVTAIGASVDITVDDEGALDAPLHVGMAYDASAVTPGHIPVVLHHDDVSGPLPLPIVAEDSARGELAFLSRDFSPHTLGQLSATAPPEFTWTGFDPARDGWGIENEGGPQFTLGGNCLGMTAFAAWYLRHPDRATRPLAGRFSHDTARLLAMRAQLAMSALWHLGAENEKALHEDLGTGGGPAVIDAARGMTRLKVHLAALSAPQVFVINWKRLQTSYHHAILIIGYNANYLFGFDPNYRDSLVRLPYQRRQVADGGVMVDVEWLSGRVEYHLGPLMAPGTVIVNSTAAEPATFRVFTAPSLGSDDNFTALLAEADANFTRSSYIEMGTPLEGERLDDRIVNVMGQFNTLDPETTTGFLWMRGLSFPLSRSGISGFTEVSAPAYPGDYPIYVLLAEPPSLRTSWYLNSAVKRINVTNSEPASQLLATMTWDTLGTDLDLYLVAPNGDTMCWNCGSTDAGAFRTDDAWNGGPEFVFVTPNEKWGHVPQAGDYRIRAHWYSNQASPPVTSTTATVIIILREQVLGSSTPTTNEVVCRYKFRMTHWDSANADPDATGPDWYEVAAINLDPTARNPIRPVLDCGSAPAQ